MVCLVDRQRNTQDKMIGYFTAGLSSVNIPSYIQVNTWVITGKKGIGKSTLFDLFVQQPERIKKAVKRCGDYLDSTNFVAGHGDTELSGIILDENDLKSYEKQVEINNWDVFWINYALLRLCHSIPELRQIPTIDKQLVALAADDNPNHLSVVSWLVERAKSVEAHSQSIDELKTINCWLQNNDKKVWLLYDGLDHIFGLKESDLFRCRQLIVELMSWWLQDGSEFSQIALKVFLDKDTWQSLDFTIKGDNPSPPFDYLITLEFSED